MFVNVPPLLACHCRVGAGVPTAADVNETTVPAQTFVLSGSVVILGLLIVSVATVEVRLPQVLENTARNWLLLCAMPEVKLNGLLVAPGMFVNPPPLLACHCSVGVGMPPAAARTATPAPAHTLVLTGVAMTEIGRATGR